MPDRAIALVKPTSHNCSKMQLWNHDHVHGLSQAKGGMDVDATHWFWSSEDSQCRPLDYKWFGYFFLKVCGKGGAGRELFLLFTQLLPSHKTRFTGLHLGVAGGIVMTMGTHLLSKSDGSTYLLHRLEPSHIWTLFYLFKLYNTFYKVLW